MPALWSLGLAALMLGPALAPGYVLSYDMVWVPDLALRPSVLGLGSGLPRAVPSDAVVAVLDELVPGAVLQKAVLLATLVGAGAGVAALARTLLDCGIAAQCLAASLAVWNPFVVERLVIGHWPVLAGYAVLPWLALAARRRRLDGVAPLALWWLLPLGSLSASAGLAAAVVVLVFGLRRRLVADLHLMTAVILANLPWLVAGLVVAGEATSDPEGAAAFATRGEGWLPAPLTAMGLGGIWNSEVVPSTREGAMGAVSLIVLLVLLAGGVVALRGGWRRRDLRALAVCWGLGWALAVVSWAAPDAIGWLAAHVPGGGLLRDGSRLLGLCVPLVAVVSAAGLDGALARIRDVQLRAMLAGAAALIPLVVLPDAAWGAGGALRAVSFPTSWTEVGDVVGDADGHDVLVLPFSSYRAPAWNGDRKVLDPLGRLLRPDTITSDELVVSGRAVEGEDPSGSEVRRALEASEPGPALAGLGVGAVVTDPTAPGETPDVGGRAVVVGGAGEAPLVVSFLDGVTARQTSTTAVVAVGIGWAAWIGWPVAVTVGCLAKGKRRRGSRRESI